MFFHCVLGAFSIGDRSQRIREACCRRQTGPGVAPCKRRCWEVGLNKTKRRDSLALDGTLSSIMTIKMANLEPWFKREPPSETIKTSKKTTGQYNHSHRSKTRTLPSFWSASDTDYASFFVIFVMHSSVLLLEKGVLFKHFICFWWTM